MTRVLESLSASLSARLLPICLLGAVSACSNVSHSVETVPKAIGGNYADQLDDKSRSLKVYKTLATAALANATILDDAMYDTLSGLTERRLGSADLGLLFGRSVSRETELAFVVSLSASDVEWQSLGVGKTWIVRYGDISGVLPADIVRLKEAKRLEPFFPYVHPWSSNYLVVFAKESIAQDGPQALTFSSPLAEFTLHW